MELDKILAKENFLSSGKSKDIYLIPEGRYKGKYAFVFTDRATGYLDKGGKAVFDPGYDDVVGEIPGKGAIACKFAAYFFRLLAGQGVPTHFIDTLAEDVMVVEPAVPIGMPEQGPEFPGSAPLLNLEWTWRHSAMGSFWRRYPFVRPCADLPVVVEAWTKGKVDRLITFGSLVGAGVMTAEEVAFVEDFVKDIARVIYDEFAARGLHVLDGKVELGRLKKGDGSIVLIDEISPDVLRVCNGYLEGERGCLRAEECITTSLLGEERRISAGYQLSSAELEKIFLEEETA